MRFRLQTLLLATAWAGLVFLGLRLPSPVMSGIISTLTLVTILLAVLVIIYRPGTSRAMATGYLIFCVGYLVHVALLAGWMSRSMSDGATTTWAIFFELFERIHRSSFTGNSATNEARGNFTTIGHHALACILGLAGALSAQWLYSRPRNVSGASPS
jgi:hypothetical protein